MVSQKKPTNKVVAQTARRMIQVVARKIKGAQSTYDSEQLAALILISLPDRKSRLSFMASVAQAY